MSNPTTPFSWQMPTATDLVTDLPADFAVFGQAVATSMADLLGGTTGQVLAKTTSTDMDFTWTTPQVGDITGVTAGTGISGGGTSGTVTVTNDMATTITTAGDLIYGTGSGTYTRRGIGSTSQVLTVAGGVPTWATPSGSGLTLISKTTLTADATKAFDNAFSATYDNYIVIINLDTQSTAASYWSIRLRASGTDVSSATYVTQNINVASTTVAGIRDTGSTSWSNIAYTSNTANSYSSTTFNFFNPFLSKITRFTSLALQDATTSTNAAWRSFVGGNSNATSYDGFSLIATSGSMNGTVYIYGLANS